MGEKSTECLTKGYYIAWFTRQFLVNVSKILLELVKTLISNELTKSDVMLFICEPATSHVTYCCCSLLLPAR